MPKTTDTLCFEGDCAKMTGRARPCPVHDVDPSERYRVALNVLATFGSEVATLLAAVDGGATLVVTGPDPLGNSNSPRIGASIDSITGARHADAYGASLVEVLGELANKWRKQC